jgi:hypothetical protein
MTGVAVLAALSAAALATNASAAFRANGVVALFCTSDTIPNNVELKLRMRWVVKNSGQITKFLSAQKLVWSVSGAASLSHTPSPEYGDVSLWSAPVHSTTVDFNNDGTIDDVWYADYLAPTGITLATGQSVTVAFTLTANAKTDDGFGTNIPAFQTISSGTSCTVTGA